MKKLLLLFSLFSLLFSLSEVRAYTSADVSNASFLAQKGIIVTQSTTAGYRLDDTITRAEAVGIALKIKGVVLPSYRCKGYFSDVRNNDWICRAVEIGADHGLVSRANTKFRPSDRITRAEALAIVMKAGNLSVKDIPGFEQGTSGLMSDATNRWQSEVFNIGFSLEIIDTTKLPKKENPGEMGGYVYSFYPNGSATRAEVFSFTKNTLAYKAIMSGEVTQ